MKGNPIGRDIEYKLSTKLGILLQIRKNVHRDCHKQISFDDASGNEIRNFEFSIYRFIN